ncbi:MAG: response regulator [Candidatus Binataceae bacterium]
MAVRVLIAASSCLERDIIRHHLECAGCEVVAESETAEQAAHLIRTVHPDVVTLDSQLGDDGDALKLFRMIRQESPATTVIMVEPNGVSEDSSSFVAAGALDCVVDPFVGQSFEHMHRRLAETFPNLRRDPVGRAAARAARRANISLTQ